MSATNVSSPQGLDGVGTGLVRLHLAARIAQAVGGMVSTSRRKADGSRVAAGRIVPMPIDAPIASTAR
jgi:hypothetical protein